MHIEEEKMNAIFTKYHIKGLPFDAVIHHFCEKDDHEHIHDHPFDFTTHILRGGYTERVYKLDGSHMDFFRPQGSSHKVFSDTIHEILSVSEGGCYTIIVPGPWRKESGFYRFENGRTFYRKWNEEEFKEIINLK